MSDPLCNHLVLWKEILSIPTTAAKQRNEINKNKKGNYIHFKLKGNSLTVSELEKKEKIDKNLLRFLTVRVKNFDLDKDYFKQENNSNK